MICKKTVSFQVPSTPNLTQVSESEAGSPVHPSRQPCFGDGSSEDGEGDEGDNEENEEPNATASEGTLEVEDEDEL